MLVPVAQICRETRLLLGRLLERCASLGELLADSGQLFLRRALDLVDELLVLASQRRRLLGVTFSLRPQLLGQGRPGGFEIAKARIRLGQLGLELLLRALAHLSPPPRCGT